MDLGASVRKLTLGALAISSFLLAGGAVPLGSAKRQTQHRHAHDRRHRME